MNKQIKVSLLRELVAEVYDKLKDTAGGVNADYIPYLQRVDPSLFGLSLCLPNGELIEAGDTSYAFGIESVSKVATAILVLKEYGADDILQKIGADATGMSFNSIFAILLDDGHPSNPLVNAGAITACSLVKPIGDAEGKKVEIDRILAQICGSPLHLIKELYESESETNWHNRSITWLLKNSGCIYDDPMMSLDVYTRQCSMGVTTGQLAICGCTIANKGFNPVTNVPVFEPWLMEKIIAMIANVGFYEHTADWIYNTGIPAKTGVGGGVMGVFPGLLGIAAFSPPLDKAGNSVKAQAAIKYITNALGLHIFNGENFELIYD